MESIVQVNNLSKVYAHNKSVISYLLAKNNQNVKGFNALKNVSFNISKGEAFAIIGRNGSGKSTLLQIIAGTVKATSGECHVNGKISALLELGSGFNPEFTGIENIYLAGSILGINSKEMADKLAEICAFAEIGDFINQPVRTYSTGMLMRVAFSVAVAVEPDILIIDEALSVGDILFQQKCNARLKQLLNKGISLVVVTHDTSFVLNMCNRALWLDQGQTRFLGQTSTCVQEYVAYMASLARTDNIEKDVSVVGDSSLGIPNRPSINISESKKVGDGTVYIKEAWLLNDVNDPKTVFMLGEWAVIYVTLSSIISVKLVSAGCELRDRHGQVIFATGLRVIRNLIDSLEVNDLAVVRIRFKLDIAPGRYTIDLGCGGGNPDSNVWQRLMGAIIIDVQLGAADEIVHGIAKLPYEVTYSKITC